LLGRNGDRINEQRRIVEYVGELTALAWLQSETADGLDTLVPSSHNKVFKGEL
jgi:hypothetical protein